MNWTLIDKDKLPFWEFLFIIFLFFLYLIPSASMGTTMLLLLLLAYCVYLMLMDREIMALVVKLLLLIAALAFFYALLTDASSIASYVSNRVLKRFISKLYQYLTLYFPAILFIRVSKFATKNQKRVMVGIGVLMMIYVIITTWRFLLENPSATRSWQSFEENSAEDIANYYFIYAVPILISAVSIIMIRSQNWFAKVLSLACVVVGVIFLVNAQYTLSILIAIIGVLIQLFQCLRSPVTKLFFGIAMLFLVLLLPQLLQFAIAVIPSAQVSLRLEEIYDFLVGRGAGGYNLNGRLTLYGDTIKAFLQSPLWGNRYLPFDGHATFLTVLSDTGLLGGIPFYAILVLICRRVGTWMGRNKKQFHTLVLMFVMMGLTNPIHASLPLGLVTWFLAPLTIQMILKEENGNETALED